MRACLANQGFHAQIVQHITLIVDQSVLSMRGKRIESHIGNDAEPRKFLFDSSHRRLRDTVRVPGFARIQSLFLLRSDREQGNGRNLEAYQRLAFVQQLIDGQAFDARHGRDGLPLATALDHENRVDQRVHAQVGFAHQTPGKFIAAHAPHADIRK